MAQNRLIQRHAVIVPCTSRKSCEIPVENCAYSLPRLEQNKLETAWIARIAASPPQLLGRDLYAGRGMALSRQASALIGAGLHIASAGLGLVSADREIPPYGLTVGHRGRDAVAARARGHFDPGAWWQAVSRGPYSKSLKRVVASVPQGLVLVALSQPYAAMLADDFMALSRKHAATLRFFGWRLEDVLDERLHDAIMPYDARLDALLPGTRCDFPQRALLHFVNATHGEPGSAKDHRIAVKRRLARASAPERPVREQVTDQAVVAWLRRHASPPLGIGRSLRLIRSTGIACEQRRFSRLYRSAAAKRGVA